MKRLIKIVSFIMLFVLVASALLSTACGKNETDTGNNKTKRVYEGLHDYTAPETDTYLVKDGRSDWVVVIPENAATYILNAKAEFCELFNLATGVSLNVLSDDKLPQKEHNANQKYISIGDTTLLKSLSSDAKMVADYDVLYLDGVRIVTKDNNIYLFGYVASGTWMAVYSFMKITFNYEQYTANNYKMDKSQNVKLRNYDVTDVPDFKQRRIMSPLCNTISTNRETMMFGRRLMLSNRYCEDRYRCYEIGEHSKYMAETNTDTIIPRSKYYAQHPKWFSSGAQWCYTAHGDEEELNAMLDALVDTITYEIKLRPPKENPNLKVYSITDEDYNNYCTCPSCMEIVNAYDGRASAIYIKFFNRLGERMDEWFEENPEYYVKDFKLTFFAYLYTIEPPVRYNKETKTYEPIDEEVILNHNVMPTFANIYRDWQLSVYDDDYMYEAMEGWAALTDDMYHYTYGCSRRSFMCFYDCFDAYNTENMQYHASVGNNSIYVEFTGGGYGSGDPGITGWESLKVWVISKLLWDTSLDSNALIDEWFDAVYGNASALMKELFYDMRMYYYNKNVENNFFTKHSIYNYIHENLFKDINVLKAWIAKGDQAKALIGSMQTTNPEEYEYVCEKIEMELVSPLVLILELFKDKLTLEERNYYVNRIKQNVERWSWYEFPIHNTFNGPAVTLEEFANNLA